VADRERQEGQPAGLVRVVEVDGEYIGTVVAVFSSAPAGSHPLCNLCEGEPEGQAGRGMTSPRVRDRETAHSTGRIWTPTRGKCTMPIALLDDGRKLEVRRPTSGIPPASGAPRPGCSKE